jgi:hypothetical protein
MQGQKLHSLVSFTTKRAAKVAIPVALLACTWSKAFAAEYIYCSLTDTAHNTVYFSDVFQGDYGQSATIGRAFSDNVKGSYGTCGFVACLFENNPHDSKAKLGALRATDRSAYGKVVDTHWTY